MRQHHRQVKGSSLLLCPQELGLHLLVAAQGCRKGIGCVAAPQGGDRQRTAPFHPS